MSNTSSIKSEVFSGLFWKFSERILAQGVSFLVSVVLARLLTPEDYGIVALVLVFINIANVFVTSGFSRALVQNKNATDVDFSTNFFCGLAVSLLIYILLYLLAPYIAIFYSIPELKKVIRVFSLRIPLSAFSTIQHAYVERHMIFRKFFFSTLLGTVLSGAVGIFLAYKGCGVWALIGQYFMNTIVDILVLSYTIPWHPQLKFSIQSAKAMMSYSWKILVADLLGTFFEQLRSLLVGRVYTSADLAYYNRGRQLPTLVTTNTSTSIMAVLFPVIANVNDNMERVKAVTRRAVKVMAYVMFPLLFGLAAVAEPLTILLFTEKWRFSIPFVRIISISSVVGLISSVSLQSIKAIGRSDILLKLEFWKKPIYIMLLIIGIRISVLAVAGTMLLYNVYATCVNVKPLRGLVGYRYKEQLQDLLVPFMLSGSMGGIVWLISLTNINYYMMLCLQIVVGCGYYIIISWLFKVDSFTYLVSLVKDKVGRKLN